MSAAGLTGRRKLTDLLFAKSHTGLPIRVGAATAVVLGILGIVTLATPIRCLPGIAGSGACFANASTDLAGVPQSQPVPAAAVAAPAVAQAATPKPPVAHAQLASTEVPRSQPSAAPAAKGLVAATFNLLQAPETGSSAKAMTVPAKTSDSGALVASNPNPPGPTTRMVKTTPIHADVATGPTFGLQKPVEVASTAPFVPADLAKAPIPAEPPAQKAEADPEPKPVKQAALEKQAAPEPAPVTKVAPKGSHMLVGGQGVNVRSGPSKSKGVLFALPGGQKVSAGENQKGWIHVTDEKGRQGWIYKTFLVNP